MKIRNGFVSNSSSASFILYGDYFELPWPRQVEGCQKLLKELKIDATLEIEDEDPSEWDMLDQVRGLLEEADFDVFQGECGIYYGAIVHECEVDKCTTEALCKKLRAAKRKAARLGFGDTPQLIYTSS